VKIHRPNFVVLTVSTRAFINKILSIIRTTSQGIKPGNKAREYNSLSQSSSPL
jgi:hypothetical protein